MEGIIKIKDIGNKKYTLEHSKNYIFRRQSNISVSKKSVGAFKRKIYGDF